MTSNGGRDGEFQLVSHVKEEYKGDDNVIIGNGPGSGRYVELQIGKVDGNLKVEGDLALERNTVSQAPQPQQLPQGSPFQWERFLHVRSIKVMLVENDDSTRHIVTALLRNCNYEVIEAANGFQAWKILEDQSNHIDIVLTEVVMPSFSGIGLLCKIMSHATRKNTPVIMMSSHDSMGLVFKCLSKGAVDFLVKPIRKNELKNLWQHVWRRCHSSSGSGSESGTNAQKSVNSKRSDDSINIISDGNGSTPDGSDDGSGTQSSWTKRAVELESPQATSPCDEINEHPDSTCGLVIHPAGIPTIRDFRDQEISEDNIGKDKELAIGGSKDSEMQTAVHNRKEKNIPKDLDPTHDVDMCGPQLVNKETESQKEQKNILDTSTKVIDDSKETITELSLKRPREVQEVQKGHYVLRHSELSAFTRYNTTSNAIKTRITSSYSQLDDKSESMKKESGRDAYSDGCLVNQRSNEQAVEGKSSIAPPSDSLDLPQVHHTHHYQNVEPKQRAANHEDSGLKEVAASDPRCGSSSNLFGGVVDGNVENYSLNRSVSGSKHGSNWQNGSSTAVNLDLKNVESDALAGKSGSGGASGNGSGGSENRIDQHKSAQREAALMKFREKRKDRCFQKKVRYQNRKRLADERPRVRGQFVKQTGRESSSNAES